MGQFLDLVEIKDLGLFWDERRNFFIDEIFELGCQAGGNAEGVNQLRDPHYRNIRPLRHTQKPAKKRLGSWFNRPARIKK